MGFIDWEKPINRYIFIGTVVTIIMVIIIILYLLKTYPYNLQKNIRDIRDNKKDYNFILDSYTFNNKPYVDHVADMIKLIHIASANSPKLENDPIKRGKISVRLTQIGYSTESRFNNYIDLLEEAKSHNIFVWLSATTSDMRFEEYWSYIRALKLGFTNIGITFAAYRNTSRELAQSIIKENGTIRLVKGLYNDGDLRKYEQERQNFINIAIMLLKTKKYHEISTHDMSILKILNENKNMNDKISFGFYYANDGFVERKLKRYKLTGLPNKTYYISYGSVFYQLFKGLLFGNLWKGVRLVYKSFLDIPNAINGI